MLIVKVGIPTVASVFEALQLEVSEQPGDLHYRVTDLSTGEVVASVSPVMVGEGRSDSGFKRFFRASTYNRAGRAEHVPRVILRVVDRDGSTLFFLDRADKLLGNPCSPQYAVADPSGVIGFITNDHYYDVSKVVLGPAGSDGWINLTDRIHLRDSQLNAVCQFVVRMPKTEAAIRVSHDPDQPGACYVGPDGTLWATRADDNAPVEYNPAAPRLLKTLLVAHLILISVEKRLNVTGFDASSFGPTVYHRPEPLVPAVEPYPGSIEVHDAYMRYQEEFIKADKKKISRTMARAN